MTFESGVIGKLGIVGVVGKVRRKVMGAAFLMGKDGERGAGSGVREGGGRQIGKSAIFDLAFGSHGRLV